MKVTDIKQQLKRQNRYSVYVDDKYAFSLGESALLDQKIHVNQEVSLAELRGYKEASQLDKYYNLALAYVARRMRSQWELRNYFRRKQIDDDSAQYIIDRLMDFGYVDDLAFARSWVDNRRLLKPVSRRRLTQELRQKRVADDIVRQVLEDDLTTDRDSLWQLIERKRKQSRYQDATKLMQYLARQGYGYEDIKSAINGTSDENVY